MKNVPNRLFAVVTPGLEKVCAEELTFLGMTGVALTEGGVDFGGERRDLYRANLWLRSASRVLVRIGSIKSRDFPDFYQKAVRLPWGKYIRPDTRVVVRASSHASRLSHTGRIAATLSDAIDRALGRASSPASGTQQLILARFDRDTCLLSLDSSGDLLHRRGYREEGARAPLRETLAAGILLRLGWDGTCALVDPMCGSGTFVTEAALIAAGRPPGMERAFAFMNWPRYRPGLWEALRSEAEKQRRPVSVPLCGSDRDRRAVEAAVRNAMRAGVADCVDLRQLELAQRSAPAVPGLVVCNPPYGERLEKNTDLRPLYRTLGNVFRAHFAGWKLALVGPDEGLVKATGLHLHKGPTFRNGGIQVSVFTTREKRFSDSG